MMFIPVDIPSKYFPLVLYAFFCLFSGILLSYLLAIAVGYCFATGRLDSLKLADATLAQAEATGCLSGLSRWAPAAATIVTTTTTILLLLCHFTFKYNVGVAYACMS
jgi:hypothetical protein